MEGLEERLLLAGNVTHDPITKVVSIVGTNSDDNVTADIRSGITGAWLEISFQSGPNATFDLPEVNKIDFKGSGGNDVFTNRTSIDSDLLGGEGNDRLYGGDGTDHLDGGPGDDALFGGGVTSADILNGGQGSDRFLIQPADSLATPVQPEDALLEFRSAPRPWTNDQVVIVDQGLDALYQFTENTVLLKDTVTNGPIFFELHETLSGDDGREYAGFNFHPTTGEPDECTLPFNIDCPFEDYENKRTTPRLIQLAQWDTADPAANRSLVRTVVHEIGHNWDSAAEIGNRQPGHGYLMNSFLAISNWSRRIELNSPCPLPSGCPPTVQWLPSEPTPLSEFTKTDTYGEEWWFRTDTVFARDYGKEHPAEDWSTAWEEYLALEAHRFAGCVEGWPATEIPEKIDVIHELFRAISGLPDKCERPEARLVSPSAGDQVTNLQSVTIQFSEPMDKARAQDVNNYAIALENGNGLAITSAVYRDLDTRFQVTLTIDSQSIRPGNYEVRLNGRELRSESGLAIVEQNDAIAIASHERNGFIVVDDRGDSVIDQVGDLVPFGFDSPTYVVAGDFDGDGHTDIVSTSESTEQLVFQAGLGEGNYALPTAIPLQGEPKNLFKADWNQDSHPDLVVATPEQFEVLLNDGSGHFSAAPETPIPVQYDWGPLHVADVTGDGLPEIIKAGPSPIYSRTSSIEIIGRDRFVGYDVVAEIDLGDMYVASFVVDDFNGDGFSDLVSSLGRIGGGGIVDNKVFFGSRAGFDEGQSIRQAGMAMFSGDLTGDQKPDLLMSFGGNIEVDNSFVVLKGDGRGGFSDEPIQSLGGRGTNLVAVADMNQDSNLDLVYTVIPWHRAWQNLTDEPGLWVWQGNGHGRFAPSTIKPTPLAGADPTLPTSVSVQDLNGDGFLDTVIGSNGINGVRMMHNDGAGTLYSAAQATLLSGFRYPWQHVNYPPTNDSVSIADLNRDGRPDIVALSSAGVDVLLKQDAGYRHEMSIPLPFQYPAVWVHSGDFNNDQLPDLVVGSHSMLAVLLGEGNGSFELAPGSPFASPQDVADGHFEAKVVDANGDGYLDLIASLGDTATSNSGVSALVAKGFAVFFGDGTGELFFNRNTLVEINKNASPRFVNVGDVDSDAIPDLIVSLDPATPDGWNAEGDWQLVAYRGNGNGTFNPYTAARTCGPYWGYDRWCNTYSQLVAGDFNGDGVQDLAGFDNLNSSCCPEITSLLHVFTGDGLGSYDFDNRVTIGLKSDLLAIEVTDFDSDGVSDLIAQPVQGPLNVFIADGTGGFAASQAVELEDTYFPMVPIDNAAPVEVGQFILLSSLQSVTLSSSSTLTPTGQSFFGTAPGGSVVTLFGDRGGVLSRALADNRGSWKATLAKPLPVGYHKIEIVAQDSVGHVSLALTKEVLVRASSAAVDQQPPNLVLPDSLIIETDDPVGAAVHFNATATDLVDGVVGVDCTPASGAEFPLGTTVVQCSATDSAGNSASGKFNVMVKSVGQEPREHFRFKNRVLTIVGTNDDDRIRVFRSGATYVTRTNFGDFTVDISAVRRVVVNSRGGDDWVNLSALLRKQRAVVRAGDGDDSVIGGGGLDRLEGGQGNDRLMGREHNDILVGGDGNDRLFGQDGFDLVIGGAGSDILNGNGKRDVLIAESFEGKLVDLNGWRQARSASSRAAFAATLADRVFVDQSKDRLKGHGDIDLFIGTRRDRMIDRTSKDLSRILDISR